MVNEPSQPPAGWYPNPESGPNLGQPRYWDGQHWAPRAPFRRLPAWPVVLVVADSVVFILFFAVALFGTTHLRDRNGSQYADCGSLVLPVDQGQTRDARNETCWDHQRMLVLGAGFLAFAGGSLAGVGAGARRSIRKALGASSRSR